MNVYRWENKTRVVEVAAKTLHQARAKAAGHKDIASEFFVLGEPGSVRRCANAAIAEDCVKTWLKH